MIISRTHSRNTHSVFFTIFHRGFSLAIPRITSLLTFERPFRPVENVICRGKLGFRGLASISPLEVVVSKVGIGNDEEEILRSLLNDQICCNIQPSSDLVDKLLHKFEDNWKSALIIFRWAGSQYGYKHVPRAYEKLVDILGKAKQLDKMLLLVYEMRNESRVNVDIIAKVMRRLSGAGEWESAIKIFDDLGTFGLEKNTETMNLLLDTLCKEKRVERARDVFLELKTHIAPNAHTFNIFIHGWCKYKRIDEANWTLQEMKGHGFRPCVITYTIIIQAYCNQFNFQKVYELLDEMKTQGCIPNVVTYTTLMHSLAKCDEFEEAFQVYEKMKLMKCKPDTLFYNTLIHVLGRAGKLNEAAHVFMVEMPMNGIIPNTSTYNTMIALFCQYTDEQNALCVLKEMEKSTFCKPDVKTYHPLLKLCFRMGKTDTNLNILLDDMINKHNISLDLSTYTLLIHGLCRANKCEKAYVMFEEMIGQGIIPRYWTCRLLLDEVKQKSTSDVSDRIEDLMKQMKEEISPADKEMAMSCSSSLRSLFISKGPTYLVAHRTFAAKAKKGPKGGAGGDALKASTLSKEVKTTTTIGANTLKDGTDPAILPDSDYPDWLWHLIDKRAALSELKRKNTEDLPYEELKRFVKLDNRVRIKDNNSVKAKN